MYQETCKARQPALHPNTSIWLFAVLIYFGGILLKQLFQKLIIICSKNLNPFFCFSSPGLRVLHLPEAKRNTPAPRPSIQIRAASSTRLTRPQSLATDFWTLTAPSLMRTTIQVCVGVGLAIVCIRVPLFCGTCPPLALARLLASCTLKACAVNLLQQSRRPAMLPCNLVCKHTAAALHNTSDAIKI